MRYLVFMMKWRLVIEMELNFKKNRPKKITIIFPGGCRIVFKLNEIQVRFILENELEIIENMLYLIDVNNVNLIKRFKQDNIYFDFIQNWIYPYIEISSLKKLDCTDYTDLYGNRIIYDINTENCRVERAFAKGELVTRNSFIRIGKIINICGMLRIVVSGNKSYVRIGKGVTVEGLMIICAPESKVIIGDDVQMARNVEMRGDDGHLIFDLETQNRIKKNSDIIVGNHVWLGVDVVLLGGANIPDGCVVGMRSITSRSFVEHKNCILAGAPAKIIRENILWSRDCTYTNVKALDECVDKNALFYL